MAISVGGSGGSSRSNGLYRIQYIFGTALQQAADTHQIIAPIQEALLTVVCRFVSELPAK
ncbi:MAG: hypothetical protein LBI05_07750 [Planctomycetaceae bacterium]|nr:hypothetical protein [Planctomycetaceae bacterium]